MQRLCLAVSWNPHAVLQSIGSVIDSVPFGRIGLFLLVLCGGTTGSLRAQSFLDYSAQYRTPLDYRTFETDHFTFFFPAGADTTAVLFRNTLTSTFEATRSIVGGDADDFHLPVVVDPRLDAANGFVSPRNFRTHLFTAHPAQNFGSKFESWPQAVAPHELTHAMHMDTDSGIGVGGGLKLLSPDVARALYFLEPSGWSEGLAVYRESVLTPGAGRLNAPLATMRYRAAMGSEDPWSIGELLYSGEVERPSNRHYIGGGQLVEYLAEQNGGTAFVHRTNQWFHRLPFLGFGVALWIGTGSSPGQISDSFLYEERRAEDQRLDSLGTVTDATVVAGDDGLHLRRPQWLDDSTLVAYGSGYSTRPGFYRIDAASGRIASIRHENITQGYAYSLGPDTTALFFSRPHPDPLVPRKNVQRVHRIDLASENVQSVSTAERVFAPATHDGGRVWAIRREGTFSTLVALSADGDSSLVSTEGLRYKQIAPSPGGERTAVLANDGGHQGIYRLSSHAGADGDAPLRPWLRFEEGTIYDLSWGPNGRYLLFAADPSGTANVYAFDTEGDRVLRLTTVRYGALEPALSPDRETLAFSRYEHEQFALVTTPFRPDSAEVVKGVERNWSLPSGLLADAAAPGSTAATPDDMSPSGPTAGHSHGGASAEEAGSASLSTQARTVSAQSRSYQAWRHLAPRFVFPTFSGDDFFSSDGDDGLGRGGGLVVSGTDPLRTWAYAVEGTYRARRLWGKVSLETGLLPGTPSLAVFNQPLNRETLGISGRLVPGVEERGVRLGVEQRVMLADNVYETCLTPELNAEFRQTRPISASSDPEGDFQSRLTLTPELTARYRVQENIRDLVPNTGVISETEVEADVAVAEGIEPSRGLRTETGVFWPVLSSVNGGLKSSVAVLTQNQGSLLDVESFVPRGYRGVNRARPGSGTHLRFDLKYTQPFWYVDAGSVLFPVVLDAVYGFALGQAQYRVEGSTGPSFSERRAAIGGGLGLSFRPFGLMSVRAELGVSYAVDPTPDQNRWVFYGTNPKLPDK